MKIGDKINVLGKECIISMISTDGYAYIDIDRGSNGQFQQRLFWKLEDLEKQEITVPLGYLVRKIAKNQYAYIVPPAKKCN